jgi:hypothetical protein
MSKDKISLRKAGEILGISHERVRQLIDKEEIKCKQLSNRGDYGLTMEILNEFMKNRKDSLVGKKKSDKRFKVNIGDVA